MENGKERWKLQIYQEDAIPLLLNLVNIPEQIIDLERILFPRMGLHHQSTVRENRYRDCTRLVLANLLLAAQRKKCLYYSRSTRSYRKELICEQNRNFSTCEKIIRIIDQLEYLKLIDQFKGFQGPTKELNRRTRIKIRKEFLNYIDLKDIFIPEFKQSDHKESFIILKDKNKNIKRYNRNDEGIRRIEKDIVMINNHYINTSITLELPIRDILSNPILSDNYNRIISNGTLLASKVSIKGNIDQWVNGYKYNINILYNIIYNIYQIPDSSFVSYCNNLKKLPVESILVFHLDDSLVKRVFNETFTNGGRFYGPKYQSLSSDIRKYIYIDGEQTTELDYSGLHVSLLYNFIGLECPDRVYGDLDGELKEIFKTVCFIVLNARDEHTALLAIVQNLKDKYNRKVEYFRAKILLDKFKDMHKPISKFFHCGMGTRLQWTDSTLMNNILIRLLDNNITGLPIHDSVIVKTRFKDILRHVMEEEYLKMFKFNPIIK